MFYAFACEHIYSIIQRIKDCSDSSISHQTTLSIDLYFHPSSCFYVRLQYGKWNTVGSEDPYGR